MLGSTDVIAMVAVKDLDTARAFYEGTLGLTPIATEGDEVVTYRSGNALFNIYRSGYAGTNQATALSWSVGDRLDDIIQALRAKGVTFEHYEMPGVALEGDVHVMDGLRAAWFKDPDGNILNISNP
jgi:catechol 2,3-dioxygenase-like lactoylglutathione lyase family enzyme